MDAPPKRFNNEWSKAYLIKPRDNMISHKYIRSKPFIPSYEIENCRPNMNYILSWEYSRIYQNELNSFLKTRRKTEKKKIIKRKEYKRPKPVDESKVDGFKMKKFKNVGSKLGSKNGNSGDMPSSKNTKSKGDQGICNYENVVKNSNEGDGMIEGPAINYPPPEFPQSYIDPGNCCCLNMD